METNPATATVYASRRGRPAIKPGTRGEIKTSAWVLDRETGKIRRRRFGATATHKADSKRMPTVRWTAEAYVRSERGLQRVQGRGKTKDEALESLEQKLHPPGSDRLAEALASESGRPTSFSDESTLGEVLDAWIADPITVQARSAGTLLRYQYAIRKTIKDQPIGSTKLGSVTIEQVTPRLITLFLTALTPAVARPAEGSSARRSPTQSPTVPARQQSTVRSACSANASSAATQLRLLQP